MITIDCWANGAESGVLKLRRLVRGIVESRVLEELKGRRILLTSSHFSRPKWALRHAMNKTKTDQRLTPVDQPVDPDVLAFRKSFDERSPLDELFREGARKMLQEGINAEVDAFVQEQERRRDEAGRKRVVKSGSLPSRWILSRPNLVPVLSDDV